MLDVNNLKYTGGYGGWRDQHITKDLYRTIDFGHMELFEKYVRLLALTQMCNKQGGKGILRDIMREIGHRKLHQFRKAKRPTKALLRDIEKLSRKAGIK